jgi:hypothetical protein
MPEYTGERDWGDAIGVSAHARQMRAAAGRGEPPVGLLPDGTLCTVDLDREDE